MAHASPASGIGHCPPDYLAAYDAVLDRWPVPYESRFVPTRFGLTHVVVSGPTAAPPVVLVPMAFGGAVAWATRMAAVSKRCRAYALDLVGEPNRSISISPIRTREDFAAWFDDLFSGLGLKLTAMIGCAEGGLLCLNQAAVRPHSVSRLVIISSAVYRVSCASLTPVQWFEFYGKAMAEGRLINRVAPSIYRDARLRSILAPTLLVLDYTEILDEPENLLSRAASLMPNAEIVTAGQAGWFENAVGYLAMSD